jgi:hypothetical protein
MSTNGTHVLVDALRKREPIYRDAYDDVRDRIEDSEMVYHLREAVTLVSCLRRLVQHATVEQIHQAFGAPGDFGYETEIGDALARTYRGE